MRNYLLIILVLSIGYSCSGKEKSEDAILRKVTRDYIKAFSDRFDNAIVMEEMLDNIHIIIKEESNDTINELSLMREEECSDTINHNLRLYSIFYANSFSYINSEKLSRIWKEGKYYVLFYSLHGPYLKDEDIPKELQRVSNPRFSEEDTEWVIAICDKNMKYRVIPNPYYLPFNCIEELNNFSCEE